MIARIIEFCARNRFLVILGVAFAIVAAFYSIRHTKLDAIPDLSDPQVIVFTDWMGRSPTLVEDQVTYPIVSSLVAAPRVTDVRGFSMFGMSFVYVIFEEGTDVYWARSRVLEYLSGIRDRLPDGVQPSLGPDATGIGWVFQYALVDETGQHGLDELRTFQDFTLRYALGSVAGVAEVASVGGYQKQYQVTVEPNKLRAFGVTLEQVISAIRDSNSDVGGRVIEMSGREYYVRGQRGSGASEGEGETSQLGRYVNSGKVLTARTDLEFLDSLIQGLGRVRTAEDVGETLVALRGAEPVLVRHLGEVRVGAALKRGEGSYNADAAVVLGLQKQPGANTLELTRRIDHELDDILRTLPAGLGIQRNVFRQADFIEVAVHNVGASLRDGVALVLVIVLVFLASARASLVTIVAIPLSLVTAIFALSALGATLNTMTLGGMAIAVGELVDDAVIDVENVVRRLRQNGLLAPSERRPALTVVLMASREIRGSIVFATLVVVAVFLPLFFLSGVEGRLLAPLGLAYVVSLGASLLVAVTVTPVLCSWLLPLSKAVATPHEPRFAAWLKRRYAPLLNGAIRQSALVGALSLALLVTAMVALALTGRGFLPEFEEGTLTISAVTLPGTSLAESDAMGQRIERVLLRHPEVVSVARRTGRAELDEHAQGVNAAELDVALRETERSRGEFLAALRRDLSLVPGMNITLGQPIGHRIDHMLSGTRASIAVKIFGDDLSELRRLGTQIEGVMRGVSGVVDLAREQQSDIPFLQVRFDRVAIARHGLSINDVGRALEIATGVHVVSQVLEGQAVFDLVVRSNPDETRSLEDLEQLTITTPSGAQVPIRALATLQRDRGPNEVGRENVQRRLVVSCNVSGRDVGSVVRDIRGSVERDVALPEGYRVVYGGQFESAEDATRTLGLLGVAALFAVLGLLYSAFGSLRDALLVLLNLPLALIGGALGVFLMGGVLSVASLVGFITLFGIATRNGIMLVSHIRHLVHEEGVRDIDEAVQRGAAERLVPILMTALAAGLGLVPLAISGGEPGSEIQAPMAVVILCGLASSTALNLFVVPALYRRLGAFAHRTAQSTLTPARATP